MIKANKCTPGVTYFLTGMWYDYNFETLKHKPLINAPVKFIGRDKSTKKSRDWLNSNGQFIFQRECGKIINITADSDLLLTPIENPEILS